MKRPRSVGALRISGHFRRLPSCAVPEEHLDSACRLSFSLWLARLGRSAWPFLVRKVKVVQLSPKNASGFCPHLFWKLSFHMRLLVIEACRSPGPSCQLPQRSPLPGSALVCFKGSRASTGSVVAAHNKGILALRLGLDEHASGSLMQRMQSAPDTDFPNIRTPLARTLAHKHAT